MSRFSISTDGRARPLQANGPMIPRYSRPEMARIFAPETKLAIWLEVEMAAAEAMAELGAIPKDAVARLAEAVAVKRAAIIDPDAVDAIEKVTRHDVIAFLTHVERLCGPDARFLHLGMTSSDLLDTTLAKQLSDASRLLIEGLDRLLAALEKRARQHKDAICIGRSHGIHAEPTTFGLKLASFYAEFDRNRARLWCGWDEIAMCAISGAVGTFANIAPGVEERVAERLRLTPEPISTQVMPRDRHAMFFATLGVIASSIERLAVEIRHLQRTEVAEAEEFFHKGQKGSSAMPHKRNPVLSENLTGLARLVRSTVHPAMENVALWHERDISHSAVERVIAPEACILLDFALHRTIGLVENLIVDEARMKRNLDLTHGLVHSQRVLLALTEAGLAREDAYALTQRNAMRAFEERTAFLDLLKADEEVAAVLDADKLEALFDLGHHTKNVDLLFERVFDPGAAPHH